MQARVSHKTRAYSRRKEKKTMLSTIEAINSAVNNFIWGVPAMICIIGVGLVLSFRTRFLQIRKFPYAMKVTFGRMFKKREASDGAMTPFQAVCTALAATVGTGNIAGVAGAIAIGGPGAVFWMWISAILGMCTKFSEVTLAVHFREKNVHGDLVGGPMYYIKNGLKKHWHWLAYLFSAFGVLTVFGTGNATQVNTITTAINAALTNYHVISKDAVPTVNLVVGIILAILIALILLGGIRRIGRVTEKLVPFMALIYIVLAVGVIILNIGHVPAVFASIVEGAFHPAAVYTYDPNAPTLVHEIGGFYTFSRFYDNGIVEEDISHGSPYGGPYSTAGAADPTTFWPYQVWSYQADDASYTRIGFVTDWNKKEWADSIDGFSSFPDSADKDHDGIVYLLTNAKGKETAIDAADLKKWVDSYRKGAKEIPITYQRLK
jgi:hypothetical protein